jgi:hypothetical protein
MQPMPPLLIMKMIITIINTKNMSGNIHQKAGQGIACHTGHGYGCVGTCSAASTDETQAKLSRAEWEQIRVRLIAYMTSSVSYRNELICLNPTIAKLYAFDYAYYGG